MGSFSIWHWLLVLVVLATIFVPYVRIIQRTGRSGFWVLLLFVPLVNIIAIWLFAFVRWPALDERNVKVFD